MMLVYAEKKGIQKRCESSGHAKGDGDECKTAANVAKTIAEVVRMCHANGVTHRDLKLKNFPFADKRENSVLKAIDFGLAVLFKPGFLCFGQRLSRVLL